jgi:thiol:disulfide interchange protein DsbD
MESRGGLIGVFFMALTLVLVSFSCTLPIAGAVALNSADGSFFKPIIGMLGFSLGIAVPFTLFAFFPGMLKTMPKSGGWMNTMKVLLAFVELAFALKFLNVPDQTYGWGILDREVYLAFWIVIFSLMGFYLLGKIRFPHDDEMPVQKSWFRYMLAIFTFSFVVYLIPGMFGAPLKAISGWLPPMPTQDFDISKIVREETATYTGELSETDTWETPRYTDKLHLPHGIFGYFDLDQALRVAKKANRPVFIDFTGHGCVNCRNVESAVWADPRVREKFAREFVVVAQYVDDKVIKLLPEDQILDNNGNPITMLGKKAMFYEQNRYKENSQPCYFIVDVDGSVLHGPIYYELNVENYLKFLEEGVKKFREKF